MSAELFLSDEWLAQLSELAAGVEFKDGDQPLSAAVVFVVAEMPSGKVRAHVVIKDGELVSAGTGKADKASVSVEVSVPIAASVLSGDLDANVAYMRGDIKVGDAYETLVFGLRGTYHSPEWAGFLAALSEATTFP